MRRLLRGPGLPVVLALVLLGCSGEPRFETAVVRGKITYRGKPVPNGTVMFVPEGDMPAATGDIQPDGAYTLMTYDPGDGAVLGPHSVMITAVEEQKDVLPEQRSGTPRMLVPLKYGSAATTELKAEVVTGENTFNFELKD